MRFVGGINMFGQTQLGQKVGVFIYQSSIKTVGKRVVKMAFRTPSFPVSIGVNILEASVKRTTGSEQLARRAALFGQIVACAPLGPMAIAGGVIRWKLDRVVDRL